MKVSPVAGPHAVQQPQSNHQAQNAARERAINKLVPQAPPVNQNRVAPEDMGSHAIPRPNIQPQNQQVDTGVAALEATAPATEPEAKSPSVKEDPALSSQYAKLARQEKALRLRASQQAQALNQREEQLKAREAALAAKDAEYGDKYISKERFSKDPLAVMAEMNMSWEQVAEQVANQQAIPPQLQAHISRMEAKLAKLEQLNEEGKKSANEAQTQQYQAAVKQIEADVKSLVATDPEFETIRETKSVRDVVELITSTWDKEGVLLTIEEAAKEVEEYLIEQALMPLTKIEKIKKRLQPAEVKQDDGGQKTQTQQTQEQIQPTRTLTNEMTASRPMSARDRAVAAFNGKLK